MRKMKPSDAPQISDVAMSTLIQILSCSNAGKVGGVQEDAIMAVSTLIEGTQKKVSGAKTIPLC